MSKRTRLVTVTIELRTDTTSEERAVLDGDDEAAQHALDHALLREVVGLVEAMPLQRSRLRLGMIQGSTGSSWTTVLHEE